MPTALITGASSGIGEQFAYLLAEEGYALAICARRAERLEAVAREASRRGAAGVSIFPADLSERQAARKLYEQTAASGLKIELLINNAGFGTRGRFDHLPLERELEQIDLNVSALLALTHLFLPDMIAARKGTIINVASTAGFQPVPYMATYAATKAFVNNLSLALSQELAGTGVNVMALSPGLTRTEFQGVAGTEHVPLPSFAYMDPRTVAVQALHAARRGRSLYINGVMNNLAMQATRIVPRGLVTRVAGMLFRPNQ